MLVLERVGWRGAPQEKRGGASSGIKTVGSSYATVVVGNVIKRHGWNANKKNSRGLYDVGGRGGGHARTKHIGTKKGGVTMN